MYLVIIFDWMVRLLFCWDLSEGQTCSVGTTETHAGMRYYPHRHPNSHINNKI